MKGQRARPREALAERLIAASPLAVSGSETRGAAAISGLAEPPPDTFGKPPAPATERRSIWEK